MKRIILLCTTLSLTLSLGCSEGGPLADDLLPTDVSLREMVSNDAPCGDQTLAVIATEENDVYVFCASEEGEVTVMEAISSSERRSLLDEIHDPVDLLKAVVPPEVDVPKDVIASIKTGTMRQGTEPFTVGRPDYSAAALSKTGSNACATPSMNFDPSSMFFNDTTYCDWVEGTSTSSNNANWHAHGASAMNIPGEGSHSHAGPHAPPSYYYADEDEEGDARYARARVHSCGGTTRFRGWKKASPTTGSWSLFAEYYVPSGWTYYMHRYSNSQKNVWMGNDADDVWFRADALGSATFGSRFYFLKYAHGPSCALKY